MPNKVFTASGAVYSVELIDGILWAQKSGMDAPRKVVSVFPDQLPALKTVVRWSRDGDRRLCGYSRHGRRACRLIPSLLKVGMQLWDPHGFRSTSIIKIE